MLNFIDGLPYGLLAFVAIFMLLAPFHPMPHALEKLIMLKNGDLKRPLDIFDLIMHITPFLLLITKIIRDFSGRGA